VNVPSHLGSSHHECRFGFFISKKCAIVAFPVAFLLKNIVLVLLRAKVSSTYSEILTCPTTPMKYLVMRINEKSLALSQWDHVWVTHIETKFSGLKGNPLSFGAR
jgi:hypothetical protein